MNALVIVAVLGLASGAPHFGVSDTPEVAAAKARFFQTYNAQAAAARAASPQQATHHQQPRWTGPMAHTRWTGPVAATVPAGVTGLNQVPNTADVQAATRSFLAAYQAQLAATAPTAGAHWAPAAPVQQWAPAAPVQARWTGPMAATVPAGVHGAPNQVSDTPEVAAAKARFFQTYNAQAAAARPLDRPY
ncbi:unnamed protein product, partial [Meganyctiphanes norvegica]